MKTLRIFILLFISCFLSFKLTAQSLNFATSFTSCLSQTVNATATSTDPLVVSYYWNISPQEAITPINFTASQVMITYTSCGVHTITCVGWDVSNAPVPGAAQTQTVFVACVPVNPLSISASAPSVCATFNSTLTAFGLSTYTWMPGSVVQQSFVVGPGTYTVTGANSQGCEVQATITIGALPPLNINVSQSSATTCIVNNFPKYSNPVHLTASGAATYVWFPLPLNPIGPTTDVRPATSTCYTVVGSTNNCTGHAIVCVSVIPQFSIEVTPAAPAICLNDSINLAVVNIGASATGPSSAFSYIWTEALNAPPISINNFFSPIVSVFPQNTTTYTVEVKDAVGCASHPKLVAVSVTTCITGLNKEIDKENAVILYPNPAKDKIFIQLSSSQETSIEIIDALGKVVIKQNKTFTPDNLSQSINISSIPAGMYFVRIGDASHETRLLKLIKE